MREIPASAQGILSYFTRHGTAANLLLVLLLIAGFAAAPQMRAQFFPDVIIDDVTVSVRWDGAGAEDIDLAIVQVLEPALLAVEGVESTVARASEGSARITMEFEPGWDMARAANNVQDAVDAVSTLPDDADDPTVTRGAWRDRVTDVVIAGPLDPETLGRFADEFVVRLFAEGVTRSTIRGIAAPRTIIEVPSVNLIQHDISMAEIAAAIAAEVSADPAGDVSGANSRVRTGVAKRSAEQISAIVLRSETDGSSLTIGDVATITVEGADRNRSYFVGENPAISVRVDRSAQGDAIGIQESVQRVADTLQETVPAGVTIDLIRTRAEAISGRLNLLLDNGLMGLGLVVMLLFLFLNARIAFWVAAGIPVAMCAAIALMYAAGITLNMISLFGLIITLGIVVDDAIVVGEHADMRARRFGESPAEAAENAARRMALPVFSATLTTIIAFFGLTAIGGRFGDLIIDIPMTVILVLTASLIECFLILPNHMRHALVHSAKHHWYDWPSRVVNAGFRRFRDGPFRLFMRFVIWARYPVLAAVVLALAIQASLFASGEVRWRFFNAPEQGSVTGNFMMSADATRADSLAMMRELQRATEEVAAEYEAEHGRNPLALVMAEIGGNTGRGLEGSENRTPDQLGGIAIELIDADLRPYSSFAFVAALQDRVQEHPLAETVSFRGWRSGPGGDSLDVQFFGSDSETLKAASEDLKAALSAYPEVPAVEDTLPYDKEELILDLTPQGAALGFTIDDLGRVLRHRLNGIEAATYPDGPRTASIRVTLPDSEQTADFLERTMMRTPTGSYVALADIVSVDRRIGFSTVRRENGVRLISVIGDISEDDADRAALIETDLEERILPQIAADRQVDWRLAGLAEQESSFLNDARTGLILCLAGIYLVLAWVFASWTRPLVVMAVIPFGLVGVIWGHHYHDVPLSMFSVVGLLGMTGIIINDSIVLVTTIDGYAKERAIIPSIIEGTAERLRPVMLTTLTTVLGLTPLLFERSQQAQFLKPTVITLVYGLGFGVVLVLLIVPSLLAAQQDIGKMLTSYRRATRARSRAGRSIRAWVLLGSVMVLGWLALTLGWFAAYQSPHPILQSLMSSDQSAGLMPVWLMFVVGAAVISALIYVIAALLQATRRTSTQPAEQP
ncbi:efflux RND transporter permease subunit [Cognatishimia maritima]|uniref:Multidrug efflux pump subunit AcrB n=1 Tax=Cognatishimia maritima TaxID=870908 RepID=A0A1M5RQQ5_9RHOB|nr:efflux RND transporter permease subunit [Cognatishimia maritima]SHH28468.1 Multidrug efflux pump subunit AcrB [Cognatishimia maritima]